MKITLVSDQVSNINEISNFSTMWAYFLSKALQKECVDLIWFPLYRQDKNFPDIKSWAEKLLSVSSQSDAILSLGVRYFSRLPLEICSFLKSNFKGVVGQIYDTSLLDCKNVDLTFTLADCNEMYFDNFDRLKRHITHNKYIGWAADPSLFKPLKEDNKKYLNIFVDHPSFDCEHPDYSLNIFMNIAQCPVPVKVRSIKNDGLYDVDLSHMSVEPYNRFSVSVVDFAKELNKADIFIVTHPESLGQTVIEAAMAGCYILTPKNAIRKDRISLVNHYEWYGKIDWDFVLSNINPSDNRKRALLHTWDMVSKRLIVAINDYVK